MFFFFGGGGREGKRNYGNTEVSEENAKKMSLAFYEYFFVTLVKQGGKGVLY